MAVNKMRPFSLSDQPQRPSGEELSRRLAPLTEHMPAPGRRPHAEPAQPQMAIRPPPAVQCTIRVSQAFYDLIQERRANWGVPGASSRGR